MRALYSTASKGTAVLPRMPVAKDGVLAPADGVSCFRGTHRLNRVFGSTGGHFCRRPVSRRERRPQIYCNAVIPFDGRAVCRRAHSNDKPPPRQPIDLAPTLCVLFHQALGDIRSQPDTVTTLYVRSVDRLARDPLAIESFYCLNPYGRGCSGAFRVWGS
jgi:hypothetical protein